MVREYHSHNKVIYDAGGAKEQVNTMEKYLVDMKVLHIRFLPERVQEKVLERKHEEYSSGMKID